MKSRRSFTLWGLLIAVFLFALVALFPLRLAVDLLDLEAKGLSARAVHGTVWNGALEEARVGPAQLGDVEARLEKVALLTGRARLALRSPSPGGIRGVLIASDGASGAEQLNGTVTVTGLAPTLPALSLAFENVDLRFADGRCSEASGRVRANLSGPLSTLGLVDGLAGTPRCEGEVLRLPLASQGNDVRLDLRLRSEGRYQLDLALPPADGLLAAGLVAAGFGREQGGYNMRIHGEF